MLRDTAILCVQLRRLTYDSPNTHAFARERSGALASIFAQLRVLCDQHGVLLCQQWSETLVFVVSPDVESGGDGVGRMRRFALQMLGVFSEVRTAPLRRRIGAGPACVKLKSTTRCFRERQS